jgi:DNA repair exonuclease SbcCD nuclease subunit
VWACYPGSPEGKRFGENGPRYSVLVNISPRQVKVEKVECQSRMLEDRALDLSGCSDEQEAAEMIAKLADRDLLLRLTLTGMVEAPFDLGRLQGLTTHHFFYLELHDRTRLFDSAFARRIEDENTVRGLFVRRARECMAKATETEGDVVEQAFREVLVRFHAFGGGES